MGAPDLLRHLKSRGASLTVRPNGNILVAPSTVLTDTDRAEIRAHKPELVALLQRQQPTCQPAPVPETPPAVRLLCGLDDHEITQMAARIAAARRAGYSLDDSEVIADRLLWRDRTLIDMHACLECARLRGRGCTARPPQQFTPGAVHELIRCPAFTPITKD